MISSSCKYSIVGKITGINEALDAAIFSNLSVGVYIEIAMVTIFAHTTLIVIIITGFGFWEYPKNEKRKIPA